MVNKVVCTVITIMIAFKGYHLTVIARTVSSEALLITCVLFTSLLEKSQHIALIKTMSTTPNDVL